MKCKTTLNETAFNLNTPGIVPPAPVGTATWRILYTCWDYGAIRAAAAIKWPPSLRAINIDRGSLLDWGCVRNCGVTAVLKFNNCPSLYRACSFHLHVEMDGRNSGSWIFPTLLPLRLQLEIHQVKDKLLGKQKCGVCSLHVWLNLQLTAYQLFCPRAVSLWADSTGCYLIQLKSSQSVHTAPSLPFQTISSCLSLWDIYSLPRGSFYHHLFPLDQINKQLPETETLTRFFRVSLSLFLSWVSAVKRNRPLSYLVKRVRGPLLCRDVVNNSPVHTGWII